MAQELGRPLKFKSPQELDQLIDDYFNSEEAKELPTITGLAVYLDTDRKTLYNYQSKDDFFPSIKRALNRCEQAIERKAMLGKLNPTMSIFTLKNNYGWVDKTEQDLSVKELPKPLLEGLNELPGNNQHSQDS